LIVNWKSLSPIYSTGVSSVGGRDGTIRSDDGMLDLTVALPQSLGGTGGATNPEQLLAGGYAASFANAVFSATRDRTHKVVYKDIEVIAEVDMEATSHGSFELSVSLIVMIAGIGQKMAEEIVRSAHASCPYSNAVRGNIKVATSTITR
jgi:lipoyl-dependent peroxiredoxin